MLKLMHDECMSRGESHEKAASGPRGLIRPPFDEGGFEKGGFSKPPSKPLRRGGGLLEGGFARNEKGFSPSTKGGFEKGFSFLAKEASRRGASQGLREGGLLKGASRSGGGSFRFLRRGGFEAPLLEAPSKSLRSPP